MKIITLLIAFAATAFAQTPPPTKQTPPPGIQVPEPDRAELAAGVATLGKDIAALRGELKSKPMLLALLPDVQIFHDAVRYALDYGEFFDAKQIPIAKNLLALGSQRAKELRAGQPSWIAATGPVVRGYISKIDGSVQPYGLSVPGDWKPGDKHARPLSLWLHGRSDNLSEVAFISGQLKSKPEFTPGGGFVVQLYGRFCNASKFAGETDLFEAWENVRAQYPIDPQRVSVLGFSMGGASVWHLATHHAGLWCAASPGAGFAETAVYAKVFGEKKEPPPWWEQMLWRCYDATAYAGNLANTSLVAYSGEIDPQKQSADIMEEAMAGEGLKLERFIGPQTAHKYEPETKKKLAVRIDELVAKGRPALPPRVRFTTYTLRYNKMDWIEVDALEKHWERADMDAELVDEGTFRITTKNVAAFTIALPGGPAPLDKTRPPRVVIDEQELVGLPVRENWRTSFKKFGAKWQRLGGEGGVVEKVGIQKHHGLTGPIDDAFMDSFVFVRPTGKPLNEKIGAWAKSELERGVTEWRRVFRGEARVIDDKALSAADVANSNLVLWGDPSSNAVLAKILAKLPLTWTTEKLALGTQSVSAADHAPVMIFPNPLNSKRYVVLNSGFTFREGSNTSNSQQTPKLPDWAVIDLKTPPSAKWPGLVVDAGFFDERWQFSAK
jgi:hypothetical protein